MGVDHKKTVFILFLACMEYDFLFVYAKNTSNVRCIEQERDALLSFKQGLIDDNGVLSSWGSEDDCCKWKGVGCSSSTGHVTALRVGVEWLSEDYYNNYIVKGKINSALLELHHLSSLDLSLNDFEGIKIPEFIGSIKTLRDLDLSDSNFSGSIPVQLGNLTNLRTLYLYANPDLQSHNLYWLSHLSLLHVLDFSSAKISDANWLRHVLMLPSLEVLYLRDCMLPDVTKSLVVHNSSSSTSSLFFLDLGFNQLTSSTFDWLFNVSSSTFANLEFLYLCGNMFRGGIPKSLENLSILQELDLSYNELGEGLEELLGKLSCKEIVSLDFSNAQLTGSMPANLSQCSKLEFLGLSGNLLEGIVSEAHFMGLHKLVALQLSFNSLTLDFSPDWIPPFHLHDIRLASCKMGPSFPKWLQTQRNVGWIDLSSNFIADEVPKWFWNVSSTTDFLNLSYNQMSGTIPDLSSIPMRVIDLSFNEFSGPIPQLRPGIVVVRLNDNKFSGSISSICNLSYKKFALPIWLIDFSNNQLEGALPNCWKNMTGLKVLNLNYNKFSGEIPHSLGDLWNLKSLHLRGNNLTGELPSTLKNCQNLKLVDIGDNNLSGNIPPWIGENYIYMTHLSFRQNRFYGDIPPEICQLNQMQMLDLSENHLSGELPQCFNNFTSLLYKNRNTTSSIHFFVPGGDGYFDYALVQWKGQDSEYKNTLGLLNLIDLSSNMLVGSIPKAFSNLRGLICLNLSRNSLTGNMDLNIGEMEMLECLDLSRNNLSGEIPASLAQSHFLAVLDLAYNNLSGKIPSSTQLQSFNESVFAGNYDLCGKPLELCPEDDLRPSTTNEGEEKDGGFSSLSFMQEFAIAMGLGFIVGFWGVVWSLLLKSSWRCSYFHFLDVVGDWFLENKSISHQIQRKKLKYKEYSEIVQTWGKISCK